MQTKPWQSVLGILLSGWLVSTSHAQSTVLDEPTQQPYPSESLLEFLADFGAVDEQTYELIEYHALQRDSQQPKEKSDDE